MPGGFDYWGLLAGIALFLFAMSQLEAGLKALGGQPLARFLRDKSGNRLNAVAGGVLATAILQSSSVVGLMVLAFTGAGLLSLPSALAIVFGSNLGTTFTGWIVATLGFKVDLGDLALPLIGIGGLTFVFARGRWVEYGRAVLSLGMLLLGLQLMKASVASIEQALNVDNLLDLAAWQYLLFGTVVAAVIQSSSATMMITLAALNVGIVNLPNAAAVAIGADLGTTTTVLIGALGGSQVKKQVAVGQIIFNAVTDAIAFLLRLPLLGLIALAGIDDPLYALVAFHSLFNFMGLLIFLPLTTQFAARLELWLPVRESHEARYLTEVSSAGDAGIDAVNRETAVLLSRALGLLLRAFEPPLPLPAGKAPLPHDEGLRKLAQRPFDELYRASKTLEGEILQFAIRLQVDPLAEDQSERLSRLLRASREAMHSAKAVKDIKHNLAEYEQSGSPVEKQYGQRFRTVISEFVAELFNLRADGIDTIDFEDLAKVLRQVNERHDSLHNDIYADVRNNSVNRSQVSSLLNVNRELLTSCRSLVLAIGDYSLAENQADDLERMPL